MRLLTPSHACTDIWSTGQDVAATIKRQLQRIFPTIKCFLDVDDLDDIAKLEQYVEESTVILILLSRGYFLSRNCLREVAAVLDKGKPYLFVHESDEQKGGAPLAALRLELQRQVQREQLFDGRRITEWHRASQFQMISLIEIAEGMLRETPSYQGDDRFSLYFPGAVHEKQLAFHTPVRLYASRNNPGAEEAAVEMRPHYKEGFQVVSEPPKHVQGVVSKRGGSPVRAAPAEPTHFLLYLSKKTFQGSKGDGLAHEVLAARAAGMPVILVHECDGERDGCAFSTFFQTTPHDLIHSGLYNEIAEPFTSGETHRKLSYTLLAKKLGATTIKGRVMPRLSSDTQQKEKTAPRSQWVKSAGAVRAQWVN